ncbi:MAG: hypothetical protein QMB53_03980, partial [Eubacteriales bacterium]
MDQDHKDPNKPQDDNPIKQAAMATFGAISSAFEKAAEVIGDAVSKENREKYAKKGEEAFSSIKDKSEDLFHHVKDFSAQTFDKVKSAMEDPVTKPYTTPEAAKDALASALKKLQEEAADAGTTLRSGLSDAGTALWADTLAKAIGERADLAVKLALRLQALTRRDDKPGDEDAHNNDEDTFFDKPEEGEIPYDSPSAPTDEADRMEKPPANPDSASSASPDKDSNSSVLET